MKRWALPLLGFVLSTVSAVTAFAEKDRYDVGEEIPTFTLKALNGDVLGESYISVDRYFGTGAKEPKKALLLSFFASYCEPCKKEMPLLAALYEAYKQKGLQIVLVSIDTEAEKVDVAKNLAKDNGVKFPVLSDRFNIVAKRYFVAKLPNSYLVGGDGKVVVANVGYNGDISKRLVEEIRKSIGEPASDPIPESISKHMVTGGSVEVVSVKGEGQAEAAEASTIDAPKKDDAATATTDDKTKAKGKAKGKGKGKAKGKVKTQNQ
jgi:alkyl hydroperoxide reductase subunit AhpC